MMDDQAPFLAAIAATPQDDAPRLVFADWLDEHGQPERAEFIRVQIANARQPTLRTRRRELALLRAHHDLFAGPLAAEGVRYEFQRGFIVGFGHVGVYAHNEADLNYLIRFYPNGDAVDVVVQGTPVPEIGEWFRYGNEYGAGEGGYTLDIFANPPTLTYTRTDEARVAFVGMFHPMQLDLRSHIDGHVSKRRFVLMPFGNLDTWTERLQT